MKCSVLSWLPALLLVTGCGSEEDSAADRQAIVLVLIDTMRWDALELAAAGRDSATPRLDALARESVRFDDAMSASGWTLPSVASLLTGTWPTVHRAQGKGAVLTPITPDLTTAPEVLQRAGYRTMAIANAAFVSPFLGLDKGFDEFDHRHAYNDRIRRADESVDDAFALIDSTEGSFFLLLHLFDAHLNYDPPIATLGRYTEDLTGPPPPLTAQHCKEMVLPGEPGTAANIEYIRAMYREEMAFLDQEIGRFIDGLAERGLYDESTFLVTADHGEEFWEHGGFEHGHTLYDELVKVPLLMKLPGGRSAGHVVEAPVRVLDVMPTVFELYEMPTPDSFVGRSLMPLVDGTETEPRTILMESTLYGGDRVAFRRGRYKLIAEGNRGELYDMQEDPGETTNLIAQQKELSRQMLDDMRGMLRDLKESSAHLTTPPRRNMSPRQRDMWEESLRSLGYLGDE